MTTTTPRSRIISTSDLGWQEFRPGISFKILWEDPATRRRAQMTRFGPGARLPRHLNYRPNGCVHSVTTQHGATVLAVVWGHTEPV